MAEPEVIDDAYLTDKGVAPDPEPEPEPPPPEPVDLAVDTRLLLDVIRAYVTDYVKFTTPHQAVAVALWVAHSWAFDAAEVTIYPLVTAPEHESGKSRLAEVLFPVVREGVMCSSSSPAAMFREIERARSTMFLDEVDNYYGGKVGEQGSEWAAIVNSGNNIDGSALRCVGEGSRQTAVKFSTFSPKLLSGRDLGKLPRPLVSRCLPIRLQRMAKTDKVRDYLRWEVRDAQAEIRGDCARWAAAAVPLLKTARPELPPTLTSRQKEGWRALLAIADLDATGSWPTLARAAAAAIHEAGGAAQSETVGTQLLADIRDVFDRKTAGDAWPVLSSFEVLAELIRLDDKPWPGWWGKEDRDGVLVVSPSAAHKLSKELAPYQIAPDQHHEPGTKSSKRRGYHRDQFEVAWSRYCPTPPPEEG